jgi:GxxExxY protein
LESAYEQCLSYELSNAGIPYQAQVSLPVEYKEIKLDCAYRIDLFVDDRLVVELKSVEQLLKIHEAQLLTYMRLAKANVGLLINFNVDLLKKDIKRLVL